MRNVEKYKKRLKIIFSDTRDDDYTEDEKRRLQELMSEIFHNLSEIFNIAFDANHMSAENFGIIKKSMMDGTVCLCMLMLGIFKNKEYYKFYHNELMNILTDMFKIDVAPYLLKLEHKEEL